MRRAYENTGDKPDTVAKELRHLQISAGIVRSDFVRKIEELSGETLLSCYQCGKCSAGCPIVDAMDLLPNQVIRLVQLGQEEKVLQSETIWLCASCFTCASRCPRGIDLAKVMEALRAVVLRRGADLVEIAKLSSDELMQAPQQALVSSFRKFTGY